IDVRRLPANQHSEAGDLLGYFLGDRHLIVHRDDRVPWLPRPRVRTVPPLAQIDVESEAKVWMRTRVCGGFEGRGPAHHHAGAGYHATFECLDDATIYSGTLPEVVGVDDELFQPSHLLRFHFSRGCTASGARRI